MTPSTRGLGSRAGVNRGEALRATGLPELQSRLRHKQQRAAAPLRTVKAVTRTPLEPKARLNSWAARSTSTETGQRVIDPDPCATHRDDLVET